MNKRNHFHSFALNPVAFCVSIHSPNFPIDSCQCIMVSAIKLVKLWLHILDKSFYCCCLLAKTQEKSGNGYLWPLRPITFKFIVHSWIVSSSGNEIGVVKQRCVCLSQRCVKKTIDIIICLFQSSIKVGSLVWGKMATKTKKAYLGILCSINFL